MFGPGDEKPAITGDGFTPNSVETGEMEALGDLERETKMEFLANRYDDQMVIGGI